MSLILEALRKSEAERRRGETPSVYSDLPAPSRTARTRLPATSAGWIAAAVVLVAVLLGARMLFDRPARPRPLPARASVAPQRPIVTLPPVPHLTPAPLPAAPHVERKASSPSVIGAPAANPSIALPAPMPTPTPAPAVTAPRDDTMRLSDLDPGQRKALPPLKLSMHMWNDDASQRFVILDGNRLREGDRIGDAVVTSITVDGVVLDWNGRKLKIPIR